MAWGGGVPKPTARRCLPLVALLTGPCFVLLSSPALAACTDGRVVACADPDGGTTVALARAAHRLVFTTPDGRELVGLGARVLGRNQVTAVSSAPNLTVVLRADMRTGRAQATAVERERGFASRPDRRTHRDVFRHVYLLSAGPGSDGCARSPNPAPGTATPRPRSSPTPGAPRAATPTPVPATTPGGNTRAVTAVLNLTGEAGGMQRLAMMGAKSAGNGIRTGF